MIYQKVIDGLRMRTGDILCMRDGTSRGLLGLLWNAIGAMVPGEMDHCALDVGPRGRSVEADARAVTVLEMPGHHWKAQPLASRA